DPPASTAKISTNVLPRIDASLIKFDCGFERFQIRSPARDLDRLLPFTIEIADGQIRAGAYEQRYLMKFDAGFDGLTAAICFLRMPCIPPFGACGQVDLLGSFSFFPDG